MPDYNYGIFKLSAPTSTVGLNILPHYGHSASFAGEAVSRNAKQFSQNKMSVKKTFLFCSSEATLRHLPSI